MMYNSPLHYHQRHHYPELLVSHSLSRAAPFNPPGFFESIARSAMPVAWEPRLVRCLQVQDLISDLRVFTNLMELVEKYATPLLYFQCNIPLCIGEGPIWKLTLRVVSQSITTSERYYIVVLAPPPPLLPPTVLSSPRGSDVSERQSESPRSGLSYDYAVWSSESPSSGSQLTLLPEDDDNAGGITYNYLDEHV